MWWELTFSVYYGVGYETCRFRRFADETPASIHSHVGTFLFMYCLFSGVTTGTAISVKEIIPYITVILYSSLCRRYPMITLPGTFSRYSFLLLYGRVTTNPLRERARRSIHSARRPLAVDTCCLRTGGTNSRRASSKAPCFSASTRTPSPAPVPRRGLRRRR